MMRQASFEAEHGADWQAFEKFLDAAEPPPFPPAEMPARYRRLCQSLALATDRQYSPDLIDRLNSLALRGHHALYRAHARKRPALLLIS